MKLKLKKKKDVVEAKRGENHGQYSVFKAKDTSQGYDHCLIELVTKARITIGIKDFPGSSAGIEFACNAGDTGSVPWLGRSAGEGMGYPLQYSWASLWLSW